MQRSGGDSAPASQEASASEVQRWVVRLDFVGANPDVRPEGRGRTGAMISYFKGSPDEWHTGLSTYAGVAYPDLWPGIDLVFRGMAARLKYEFVVQPGADPGQIRLAYRGATGVALNAAGELEVSTPVGGFHDAKPYAYREVTGRHVEVAASYALAAGPAGAYNHGFALGPYDPSLPLVLDPEVFIYAGYIGGAGYDYGYGIAVDGAGNAYVTGHTLSCQPPGDNFPVLVGPDLTCNSGGDAFVVKVQADGMALVYAGFIGGSGYDEGRGIAVDEDGNAYVAGYTDSTQDQGFPVLLGPDLTYNGGWDDAFVAKVEADGTGLVYAGYIGGSDYDYGRGIAVDGAGNAYVSGDTYSTEATFPDGDGFGTLPGPDLELYPGGYSDAFVAKVRVDGRGLVYAGYIGGSSDERGYGIAVDGAGNAYVTGQTSSDEYSFPVRVGPDLTFGNHGGPDAFVAKVQADGTGLVYAGYIGGWKGERAFAIAVDGSGNAYVTGLTDSSESSPGPQYDAFPVLVGPDLTLNGFGADAFVAKVKADGTGLAYAGYIGGSSIDYGYGVAVDDAGSAYVTGVTMSTEDLGFPVLGGPDLTHNGNNDAFVAKVQPDGTGLVYASYIGGVSADDGWGVAVDGTSNAYVTGLTMSGDASFPDGDGFGAVAGPDSTSNGLGDAFVVKIGQQQCDVIEGDTYTFDAGTDHELAIFIAAVGDLDCLRYGYFAASHPQATGSAEGTGTRTGRYWILSGVNSSGLTPSNYRVSLDLAHNLTDPTVCRYVGPHWDCGRSTFTPTTVTRDGITSLSTWALGESILPAEDPTVSASQSSSNIILSWANIPADGGGYVVWHSETPYFLPNDPGAQSVTRPAGSTGWTHTGGAGNPAHNHYYVVQGVNGAGVRSGPSNRVAVFSFNLIPGAP